MHAPHPTLPGRLRQSQPHGSCGPHPSPSLNPSPHAAIRTPHSSALLAHICTCRVSQMPPCCKAKLVQTLHFLADLLTAEEIPHWIDMSTTLGAVRHNGHLIPWDYDADMGIM